LNRLEHKSGEDPIIPLCRMVVGTEYDDLPGHVVDFAEKHLLDTVGATIGGSSGEMVSEIVGMVRAQGGKRQSVIPCYGYKVPAPLAAFATGPMTRVLEICDVHGGAGHTADYVFPGLLAATGLKKRVTGKEFIAAFVVGQEVLIRIGTACNQVSKGVPLGFAGGYKIFGAVGAVARLMGLTLEQTVNAMGIAGAMTQPHDLTMNSRHSQVPHVHHGFFCQDAVTCCLVAQMGIVGPHNILMGGEGVEAGYFRQFCHWETDPSVLTRGLGREWLMTGTTLKLFASGLANHTSVGAAIDLVRDNNIAPRDISEIRVDLNTLGYKVQCLPREAKWNPQTHFEARLSLPYVVAIGILDKKVLPDAFSDAARARQDVRRVMEKVAANEDPGLPSFGARVMIRLVDGTRYEKEAFVVKGHPDNPLSTDEIVSKFRGLMSYASFPISAIAVNRLIERLLKLENVEDFGAEVVALLVPQTMQGVAAR